MPIRITEYKSTTSEAVFTAGEAKDILVSSGWMTREEVDTLNELGLADAVAEAMIENPDLNPVRSSLDHGRSVDNFERNVEAT